MKGEGWVESYQQSHQHPVNRALHAIGIPMIVLSLCGMFWNWRVGLAFFALGWILQFLGHAIEGKAPAFFKAPLYLVVGPIWWLKKVFRKGA